MAPARTVPGLSDRRLFSSAVRRLCPLDDSSLGAVFSLLRACQLARGEYFLRAGERATEVTLVVRGLLREHFVLPDGSERTKAFVAEGELSGSWADLLGDGWRDTLFGQREHAQDVVVLVQVQQPTRQHCCADQEWQGRAPEREAGRK